MSKHTKGAFGGYYNHQVIKELRAELGKSRLMLAALCKHTNTTEAELLKIATDFLSEQRKAVEDNKKI